MMERNIHLLCHNHFNNFIENTNYNLTIFIEDINGIFSEKYNTIIARTAAFGKRMGRGAGGPEERAAARGGRRACGSAGREKDARVRLAEPSQCVSGFFPVCYINLSSNVPSRPIRCSGSLSATARSHIGAGLGPARPSRLVDDSKGDRPLLNHFGKGGACCVRGC